MATHTHRTVRLQDAVDRIVRVIRELSADDEDTNGVLLGDLIRQEREAWGLSLADLGKQAGLSKAHVWELEQGRALNPGVEALSGLAEALRLPPAKLFAAALESRRILLTPLSEAAAPH